LRLRGGRESSSSPCLSHPSLSLFSFGWKSLREKDQPRSAGIVLSASRRREEGEEREDLYERKGSKGGGREGGVKSEGDELFRILV